MTCALSAGNSRYCSMTYNLNDGSSKIKQYTVHQEDTLDTTLKNKMQNIIAILKYS